MMPRKNRSLRSLMSPNFQHARLDDNMLFGTIYSVILSFAKKYHKSRDGTHLALLYLSYKSIKLM
jgi:hypothetical protein